MKNYDDFKLNWYIEATDMTDDDDVHIYELDSMTRREVDEFVRDLRRKGELMNRKVFISEKPDEEFEDSKW